MSNDSKEINTIKNLSIIPKCHDLLYLIDMARTRNPEVDNQTLEEAVRRLLDYSLSLCPDTKKVKRGPSPLDTMKKEGINFFDECLARHKKRWVTGTLLGITEDHFAVRVITEDQDGDVIDTIFTPRIKSKREKKVTKKAPEEPPSKLTHNTHPRTAQEASKGGCCHRNRTEKVLARFSKKNQKIKGFVYFRFLRDLSSLTGGCSMMLG